MPESLASPAREYPPFADLVPSETLSESKYEVRFARSPKDLDALLRLRFEVFNLELGEGLDSSFETGRDRDEFDAVCHHLVVVEKESDEVVGTYRMQTHTMAAHSGLGFYSAAEFDLAPIPKEILGNSVEVGRACVAIGHRNTQVLYLLWKGLALYMATNHQRYLFGCCSLTSQDPEEGRRVMNHLETTGHLHPELQVLPRPEFECYDNAPRPSAEDGPGPASGPPVRLPKLFRTYLRHGAKVCGPPAIDRQFKTIDYLVIFDVAAMDERRFRTFFG